MQRGTAQQLCGYSEAGKNSSEAYARALRAVPNASKSARAHAPHSTIRRYMAGLLKRRMSFPSSTWKKPAYRVFITDWDDTATLRDTTALIAETAEAARQKLAPRDCHQPFSHFTKIYLEAYSAYIKKASSGCGKRDTLAAEREFQKGMRSVELTSVNALEESRFFKGVPVQCFRDLVPRVELRPGFISFCKRIEGPVYILSVNWCRALIQAVLKLHNVENVTVLANDLESENGVTTGNWDKMYDIRTGYDKVVEMEKVRALHPGMDIVYFGDSSGDVLPILEADYGVIIKGGGGRKIVDNLAQVYGLKSSGFDSLDILKPKVFEATWVELDAAWNS